MKGLVCVLVAALAPAVALAAEKPEWAFPVTEKTLPPPRIAGDQVRTKALPGGGTLTIKRAQADDFYNAPDWRPDLHPAMPKIVQHGNKDTQVRACGSCHLPTGNGHDESAYLAGLPIAYFMRQMADWKSGARKYAGIMVNIAKAITDDEVRAAARYYTTVKPRKWIRVVETDTVPKSFIGPGNKRLELPAGGTEPLGNQIIEVPENEEDVVYRDPTSGFIAYVPKGSIAKGENLVRTGGGKTTGCAICHGPTLQGMADVPPLAGRHPNYIVRQLWNVQNGERNGKSTAQMQAVVAELTNDDMLAIAAYIASQNP